MRRSASYAGGAILLVVVAALIAWATTPDPKFNPASFEEEPLVASVAPLSEAVTLSQFANKDGVVQTMLVLTFTPDSVTGIDLEAFGATASADPFKALAGASGLPSSAAQTRGLPTLTVPIERLLATGSPGARHIGTGTNFPEHAEAANSGSVFQFPKFGAATSARTTVRREAGVLLDYEVELCLHFDRDIRSLDDFDAAMKAFFLCGDFTNRNALIELADPDNLDSGSGFSDAKSGPDFFPTGPFLVIPRDWRAFVAKTRMTTSLNEEPRQDAREGEMTLDFRALAERALGDMSNRRFLYKDEREFLAEGSVITKDMTVMSGTSEGVIFTSPTRGDLIEAVATYVAAGGPFSSRGFIDIAKTRFIANEWASGHFLQPGVSITPHQPSEKSRLRSSGSVQLSSRRKWSVRI